MKLLELTEILLFGIACYSSSLLIKKTPPLYAGKGLLGTRQKDLIQWYVAQQNEKNSYSSMEEARNDVRIVRAIIQV